MSTLPGGFFLLWLVQLEADPRVDIASLSLSGFQFSSSQIDKYRVFDLVNWKPKFHCDGKPHVWYESIAELILRHLTAIAKVSLRAFERSKVFYKSYCCSQGAGKPLKTYHLKLELGCKQLIIRRFKPQSITLGKENLRSSSLTYNTVWDRMKDLRDKMTITIFEPPSASSSSPNPRAKSQIDCTQDSTGIASLYVNLWFCTHANLSKKCYVPK